MSAPRARLRTVTEGTQELTYELVRKQVKNFNLRVRADGSVTVSAPPRVPLADVERFVRAHIDFIVRARERIAARAAEPRATLLLEDGVILPFLGKPHVLRIRKGVQRLCVTEGELVLFVHDPSDRALCMRALRTLWRDEAARVLTPTVEGLLPLFAPLPASLPTLCFRDMKTRWGICRPTQHRITLNTRLLHVPPACAVYVICHELAHFRHPDHSKHFYAHLAHILPDWEERRRVLNTFSIPVLKEEDA